MCRLFLILVAAAMAVGITAADAEAQLFRHRRGGYCRPVYYGPPVYYCPPVCYGQPVYYSPVPYTEELQRPERPNLIRIPTEPLPKPKAPPEEGK